MVRRSKKGAADESSVTFHDFASRLMSGANQGTVMRTHKPDSNVAPHENGHGFQVNALIDAAYRILPAEYAATASKRVIHVASCTTVIAHLVPMNQRPLGKAPWLAPCRLSVTDTS